MKPVLVVKVVPNVFGKNGDDDEVMVVDGSSANVDDAIQCDGNNNGYGSSGDNSRLFIVCTSDASVVLMLIQVLVKIDDTIWCNSNSDSDNDA